MKLHQALFYFVREALVSLGRSWKVSLLAVVTIAVSLFIGGAFLAVGRNLSTLVERWRAEARVVVYLRGEATAAERSAVVDRINAAGWVTAVEEKSAADAAAEFRRTFPSLADLVEGDEAALPPSIEVVFDPARAGSTPFTEWLAALRDLPGVAMVDDDRDWLRQLETLIALVQGAGLVVGSVLLAAAIFTIASVIRLTAYLYQEEIAVMRMVGATEFFIRGPFYAEGLLQGLVGGLAAVAALAGAYALVARRVGGTLLGAVVTPEFLGWRSLAALVVVGGVAGLAGAIASLRRESLGGEEG